MKQKIRQAQWEMPGIVLARKPDTKKSTKGSKIYCNEQDNKGKQHPVIFKNQRLKIVGDSIGQNSHRQEARPIYNTQNADDNHEMHQLANLVKNSCEKILRSIQPASITLIKGKSIHSQTSQILTKKNYSRYKQSNASSKRL